MSEQLIFPSMTREPNGLLDRWIVEIKDVDGRIVSREGYLLKRWADRRAIEHNAHARGFVEGLRLSDATKKKLPDQLYYAKVRKRS